MCHLCHAMVISSRQKNSFHVLSWSSLQNQISFSCFEYVVEEEKCQVEFLPILSHLRELNSNATHQLFC
jgi:hypothetical protein